MSLSVVALRSDWSTSSTTKTEEKFVYRHCTAVVCNTQSIHNRFEMRSSTAFVEHNSPLHSSSPPEHADVLLSLLPWHRRARDYSSWKGAENGGIVEAWTASGLALRFFKVAVTPKADNRIPSRCVCRSIRRNFSLGDQCRERESMFNVFLYTSTMAIALFFCPWNRPQGSQLTSLLLYISKMIIGHLYCHFRHLFQL